MFLTAFASLLLASSPVNPSSSLPRLVLSPQGAAEPSASLLRGERPASSASLEREVGRSTEVQLAETGKTGRLSLVPSCRGRNGVCDNSSDYSLLAGLVGFFIGFGIGHLITGNVGGFIIWLLIDLLVVGVFFIALPASGFAQWGWVSLVALVVDRTIEAFSAAASATHDHVAEEALPPQRDAITGGPAPQAARLVAIRF